MPEVNIAQEGLMGAGKGAMSGAAIGTAALPGIGTAIGAGVGAIVGFFGGRKSAQEGYAANKSMAAAGEAVNAPVYDAGLSQFARELRKEKRMVQTGMTPEFQVGKGLIEKAGAGGMNIATRFNNPAMAMSFMSRIQTGMGANINKLVGTAGARADRLTGAIGGIKTTLAEREMELSQRGIDFKMFEALGDKAQYTQNVSDRAQNNKMMSMYALSQLPGIMSGGGGGGMDITGTGEMGSPMFDLAGLGGGPSISSPRSSSFIGSPLPGAGPVTPYGQRGSTGELPPYWLR